MATEKQQVLIPDYVTVRDLAELIKASPIAVMKKLIASGTMVSINQQIDFDTAAIVVEDMGFEAVSATAVAEQEKEQARAEELTKKFEEIYQGEDAANLVPRPPVVTILGHVDHGKTTLLDTIRSASVAAGEAGGITQHIGAYRVQHEGRYITFLDTPGHQAFTAMRARGSNSADIAILVVAADDGVMPTTREALNHARAANLPVIVAITKVDKHNANVDRVKQQLAQLGLQPDDWDGDTIMIPVNSLKKEGIPDLLEAILLVADSSNFVANPKGAPRGVVLEARMDRHRGTMATLLVQNGTLRVGDYVLVGTSHGRIKAMYDDRGKPMKEATPSTPVEVLGLNEPPIPGDRWETVKNEREARAIVQDRLNDEKARSQAPARTFTLEDLYANLESSERKEINLIIKVDVQGSIQPITETIADMSENNPEKVRIRVLAAEVGSVSEADVMLASASKAIIIAFNTDVPSSVERSALSQRVEIRKYNIIYKLFEDLEMALKGMLDPKYEPKTIGKAEVRAVFKISRVGAIAGCYMLEGEARRNAKARVYRQDKLLAENVPVGSLKRFNEDVREVRTGYECGVGLDGFSDFAEGDIIEFFVMERVN
ncbi:MAG: translation initiation factor IF-2 [Anaerolineae bacterium]